jgi:hypothetical protein
MIKNAWYNDSLAPEDGGKPPEMLCFLNIPQTVLRCRLRVGCFQKLNIGLEILAVIRRKSQKNSVILQYQ